MPQGEIFTADDYREVYPPGIERHFWNLARNDLVFRWLRPRLGGGELAVDVGCGTGMVVNELRRRGLAVRGVELGDAPVIPGAAEFVDTGTDLFELGPRFGPDIRAVLLLDVLEHIGERRQFLARIREELPACRFLLVTVPARMELWSGYDEHWGHNLRYDRPTLEAELSAGGFTPLRCSYFFHWLYLVSVLMKMAGVAKSRDFAPIRPGSPGDLLHRGLGLVTKLESRLVPGSVAGSSIICLAERKP